MPTPPVTNPLIAGEARKPVGLDFRLYQKLKIEIHRELLNHIDPQIIATQRDDNTRRQVYAVIQQLASNLKTTVAGGQLTLPERDHLSLEILNEVFRLGPLEPLLQDPTISDILVNGANQVYIERAGVLEE